jgi:hypothetical protein
MFVTAFFRPKTSYRSIERYLTEFQKFADTGVSILLFLDKSIEGLSFPANVQVVPIELDTSWIPEDARFPAHRNPHKDTLEYFCIQVTKLYCMKEALKYTDDAFLAWLDFGAFHMFRDTAACSKLIKDIAASGFPTRTILAPGCWPAGVYDWNSVCWRFCGTFLLGHRDLFRKAYDRQSRIIESYLPRVTWEVNYWAQMDDLFTVYMANHDDTLLSRVMMFVQRQ